MAEHGLLGRLGIVGLQRVDDLEVFFQCLDRRPQ
jgi:hypothetical protein